jgi:hypothetical protein
MLRIFCELLIGCPIAPAGGRGFHRYACAVLVLVAEVECVMESKGKLVGPDDCLGDILYQRSGIYVRGCTVKKCL